MCNKYENKVDGQIRLKHLRVKKKFVENYKSEQVGVPYTIIEGWNFFKASPAVFINTRGKMAMLRKEGKRCVVGSVG